MKRVLRTLRRPGRLLLPSVLWIGRTNVRIDANYRRAPTFDESVSDWTQALAENPARNENIGRLYDETQSRVAGLEAKAVGMLSAAAIVTAGALVALASPGWARILAAASLIYLCCAVFCFCWTLYPRQRYVLVLPELRESPSGGYAELAAATSANVPILLKISNVVTRGIQDLVRSTVLVLAALVVVSLQHAAPEPRNRRLLGVQASSYFFVPEGL
jgi:hypothetical protein